MPKPIYPPIPLDVLARHRQAIAPLWKLVQRAKAGEDINRLIAIRKRFTRRLFNRNPDLKRINDIIELHYVCKERSLTQSELIAAAYRWTFDLGKPMPPGLKDDNPRVLNLVEEYKAAMSWN